MEAFASIAGHVQQWILPIHKACSEPNFGTDWTQVISFGDTATSLAAEFLRLNTRLTVFRFIATATFSAITSNTPQNSDLIEFFTSLTAWRAQTKVSRRSAREITAHAIVENWRQDESLGWNPGNNNAWRDLLKDTRAPYLGGHNGHRGYRHFKDEQILGMPRTVAISWTPMGIRSGATSNVLVANNFGQIRVTGTGRTIDEWHRDIRWG
ncbi:MAG: hypothetical protein Q9226_006397 [Calogaya cf. arnoldii]